MTAHSAWFPAPHHAWRDLYLQALFETDKSKICVRISEAERALLSREHELFAGIPDPAEREEVNTALHALSALRTCLSTSSRAPRSLTPCSALKPKMAHIGAFVYLAKDDHVSTTYPRAVFLEARKLRRRSGSACS